MTFIGAHDSPFVGGTFDLATNQGKDVTAQLDAGIHFLQGQTHLNSDSDLHFCHTYCWLEDAGPVQNYLASVKSWMDNNPDDVITLLLTNGGNVGIEMFAKAFEDSKLDKYAYTPPHHLSMSDWPTVGEMISNDTRLVVFLDYGANRKKVPYILSEFDSYMFETPFDTTDPGFPECSLNRPAGGEPDGRMYVMNHFLDKKVLGASVPDVSALDRTNAATGFGSIGAQADICIQKYGRAPNFILVDRFNVGKVRKAQAAINDVA